MANSPPRATYRTIAKEAGVSAVTVSLSLRNHFSIPEITRQRIQKIAADQGYQADPHVAKLMHHLRMRRSTALSSNLVALRQRPETGEHYQSRVLAGVMERTKSLGYSLEVIDLEEPPIAPARLRKILRSRGVEGIILLPMKPVDLGDLLDWSRFSVVATSHSVLNPRFHTVVPNQFSNMLRLCEQLAATGETSIGMVSTKTQDLKVNHRFISAYACHAMTNGRPLIPPLMVDYGPGETTVFLQWFKKHNPGAVIVTSQHPIEDRLPPAVRRGIKWIRTGLFADASEESGIFENPQEIGRAAIDILAGMLQRGDHGIPLARRCTEIEGEIRLTVSTDTKFRKEKSPNNR